MGNSTLATRMIRRCIWPVLCACALAAHGATKTMDGRKLAQELQGNVVRIKALNTGFGFIVAERGGQVYIVTANHVVRDNEGQSEPIVINFYQDQKKDIPATLLPKFAGERDVAVIQAPLPGGHSWRREAMGRPANLVPGVSKLWYVGRWELWEIPPRPGFVNRLEGKHMVLEMRVARGSSGAPLIADDGIVGLVLAERNMERGLAVRLDTVQNLLVGWSYPWDMKPDPKLEPAVAEATRYYDLGIYDEALRRYEEAARKGNPHAMAMLGAMYMGGNGTPQNASKALEWFARAADLGDSNGMLGLAFLYNMGMGVNKDPARAVDWLRRATELGSVEGMVLLGIAYEQGSGVSKDLEQAIRLYYDACRRGSKLAEVKLREHGRGPCE